MKNETINAVKLSIQKIQEAIDLLDKVNVPLLGNVAEN